jgi:hypothetical protein
MKGDADSSIPDPGGTPMMRTRLAGLKASSTRQVRRRATTRPSLEPLEQRSLLASLQLVGTPSVTLTATAGSTTNQTTIPLASGQESIGSFDASTGEALTYFTYDPTSTLQTLSASLGDATYVPYGAASGSVSSEAITFEVVPDGSDSDAHLLESIDLNLDSTVEQGGGGSGSAATTLSYDAGPGQQGSLGTSATGSQLEGEDKMLAVPFNTPFNLTFGFTASATADSTEASPTPNGGVTISVQPGPLIEPSLMFAPEGGVDYGYTISNADLPEATTVDLYWASGTTPDTEIGDPIATTTTDKSTGGYGPFHVAASILSNQPAGARYLLAVADPDNTLSPADPSKWASLALSQQWTGLGSDDLWSDGDNWLGGFAPTAGADLLFPSDAQQQANVNDLGYTFNSVAFAGGNYDVSGQTLSTTGALDFQGGATELDCSATTAGPTTIEAGASLTIGADATLDVLNTDPFNIDGKLSLLGNCDLAGDASVGSMGELDAGANAKCSAEANSTLNLDGKATFDDGSVLTAYCNTTLNFGATGTASLNGTATFMPSSYVNLLPNTTLNTSGSLTLETSSNWNESFGAAWTAQSGSNAYIYGNMSSSGTCQINAGANIYQYSGSQAFFINGSTTCNGTYTGSIGSTIVVEDHGFVEFQAGTFEDRGHVQVQGSAAVLIDLDAITVAAGATLDVSGTLTEGVGGHLDDFGAVTIEPGGILNDDSTVTVEAGATLDVLGTLSIGAGGIFNVAPGAVYTVVTNTNDDGPGSLRQAILNANVRPGSDDITFDIPGSGVQTIALASALPSITDPLTIDGWTQPGFAGMPLIELNGANAGLGANGLVIAAGNSTVRGLAIDQFGQNGILLSGGGGDLIAGNDIGVDADGTADGNAGVGVLIGDGASGNTVGGTTQGAGNVIAYNTGGGVAVGLKVSDAALEDAIEENSIFSNGGLGIDVNNSAPQTPPVEAGAINVGSQTTITGTFTGIPNASYRVEFFSSPPGAAQGQTYLGFTMVTAGASGSGSFSFSPASSVAPGLKITATATDPNGNTSEFSSAVTVQTNAPTPPMIIGEQTLFQRKTNRKGKPVGKAVLTGFTIRFSSPLDPRAAANPGNYRVATATTKKVKKQVQRILHPLAGITVVYSPASDSVTLTLPGSQTFRTGGEVTIVGGAPGGIVGASGGALGGLTVFTIAPKGRSIAPA